MVPVSDPEGLAFSRGCQWSHAIMMMGFLKIPPSDLLGSAIAGLSRCCETTKVARLPYG